MYIAGSGEIHSLMHFASSGVWPGIKKENAASVSPMTVSFDCPFSRCLHSGFIISYFVYMLQKGNGTEPCRQRQGALSSFLWEAPFPVRRGALASSSNALKTLVKDDPSAFPSDLLQKKYSKFPLHVYSLSCIIITIQFKTIYEEGLFYSTFTRNTHLLKTNQIV